MDKTEAGFKGLQKTVRKIRMIAPNWNVSKATSQKKRNELKGQTEQETKG